MSQISRFRFSLLSLIGLVAFAAIGCAALVNASFWLVHVVFNATVAAFLLASLIAVAYRRRVQAFSAGFAICGWAYLFLVIALNPAARGSPWYFLATDHLLYYVYHGGGGTKPMPNPAHFHQVGHCLFALLFAFLGGLLAQYLYATREGKLGATEPEKHDDPHGGGP